MKRLLVCLLLVGIVGCGETQQVAQQPSGETTQNEQQPNSEQPSGESEQEAQQPNDNIQQEPTPAAKKSVEGREPLTLEGHSDWVLSVSFSPDGQRLACARDGSLEVWDVHSLTKSKWLCLGVLVRLVGC